MPGTGRRTGLRLAVAHDARDDQIGVVESGAERRGERVAELTALVDRARNNGSEVAGEAAGPREVVNQPGQPLAVARELGLDVLQAAVDPKIREIRRRAVTRTGDQQDARVRVQDQPV